MRGSKVRFTDEQIADMKYRYETLCESIRDISKTVGVSTNTVRDRLIKAGVAFDAGVRISKKMTGKIGHRKGCTHTDEAKRKMSDSRKGGKPTTLGKIYTPAERLNISIALKAHYAKKYPPKPIKEIKPIAPKPAKIKSQHMIDMEMSYAIGFKKIAKARNKCKSLLRRILNLTGRKKVTKTYDALGYTEKELISHIEKTFKVGMSWDVRESFHIDHIIPVAWFIRNGITDPKVINALDNLQALYPDENRKKSDSFAPAMRQIVLSAHFDTGHDTTYTCGV